MQNLDSFDPESVRLVAERQLKGPKFPLWLLIKLIWLVLRGKDIGIVPL